MLRRVYFLFFLVCSSAFARDYIHVVGSTAVFPFVSIIAEEFARTFRVKTPIVESTGTSAGLKLFCSGTGDDTPDVVVASRKINDIELALCKINSIEESDILEVKLGDDAIVIASVKGGEIYNFSKNDIFNAIAFYVPKDNLNPTANNYRFWNQINTKLPELEIKIYGPLRNTGTFDAVVHMILLDQCLTKEVFKMTYNDKDLQKVCSLVRDDGVYIEASSDENAVIQKVVANSGSFGLFSYSFLVRNTDKVQAHKINNIEASYPNIVSGLYPITRPIYVYVKKPHIKVIKNLKLFITEVLSEDALEKYGYLRNLGLIPPSDADLEKSRKVIASLG